MQYSVHSTVHLNSKNAVSYLRTRLSPWAGHPSSTSPPPSPLEEALLELEALFVAKVVAVGGSKDETRGGALMTGATQTIGGGGDGASGSHSGSNRLLKRARNNELSCLLRTCINSENTNSGSGSGNGNGSGNGSVVVAVNGHFRRGLLAALASPSPVPWRDPNKPLKVCAEAHVPCTVR